MSLVTNSPEAAATHRSARAWVITGLITVFMMINWADKALLGLAAIPLMEELQIDEGTYGLIASSFFTLFSVSSLLVGFWADRLSSRAMLAALAVGWTIANVPLLVSASVATLFLSRILLGAAEGPAAGQGMHALCKWFVDERRAVPLALFVAGMGGGTFVSAPILTWIIQTHGWRAAFATMAVVSLVWCSVWLLVGKDGPIRSTPKKTADGTAQLNLRYRDMMRSGTFIGSICSGFGAYWAVSFASAFLPAYLISQQGYSPLEASGFVSVYAAASVVVILVLVPFVDRLRSRGASVRLARALPQGAIVLVAGIAMAALPFIDGEVLRYAAIAVAFGLCQLAWPLGNLTAASITTAHQRSRVLGTFFAIETLPGLLAPMISGWIIGGSLDLKAGYTTAFLVGGILMIVLGAISMAILNPARDLHRLGLAGAAH